MPSESISLTHFILHLRLAALVGTRVASIAEFTDSGFLVHNSREERLWRHCQA